MLGSVSSDLSGINTAKISSVGTKPAIDSSTFWLSLVTYRDVYIGKLSEGPDPLDWGGDWNGNLPASESPLFPPHGADPFSQLITRIKDGRFSGKQVDWGGWVAKVSKAEILRYIAEIYCDDDWYADRKHMPHLYDRF